MEPDEREDDYRWELPPTVLQKWRDALTAEPDESSETPPPVVPYTPAA